MNHCDGKNHVTFAAKSWRKIGRAMPMTRKGKCAKLVSSQSGQWQKKTLPGAENKVLPVAVFYSLPIETGFDGFPFCPKSIKDIGGNHMTQKIALSRRPPRTLALSGASPGHSAQEIALPDRSAMFRRILYWSLVAIAAALILSLQPVFAADTIWTKFSDVMKDIYGKLLGVSTIIAVTAATIALLVRMISRNQRAVDEATTWLKRIVITWIILNCLGFIIAYLSPWFQGGQYTP